MQDRQDFDVSSITVNFDFKSFFFKVLSFWPWFLVTIGIGLAVAYYVNVRKLDVFEVSNLVSIKDDQNPFFTSNTSLTFNWGGTTDKVYNVLIALRTRNHNEEVVQKLQYYVDYEIDGEYQRLDAYGRTAFTFKADTTAYQMLNTDVKIEVKNDSIFNLSTTFLNKPLPVYHYGKKKDSILSIDKKTFERDYRFGDLVALPFLRGTFYKTDILSPVSTPVFIKFRHLDAAVSEYKGVKVEPQTKGSSVLRLSKTGNNKSRIVDYLNTTVQVLSENLLERKNLFATKTINFIEKRLNEQGRQLDSVEDELNAFRIKNAIVDIDSESTELNTKIGSLEGRRRDLRRQLDYLETLENYLRTRTDYSAVPVPSVAGISEGNIVGYVTNIIALAEERNNYQYAYKEDNPIFDDIDRRINSAKSILFENISSSQLLLNRELNQVQDELSGLNSQIRRLPKEQQDLLKIERRYNINEETYNLFLSKLNEARLVKAANVSDVVLIEKAKDTGGGKIGPNTRYNYILAVLVGLLLPLAFVFMIVFFDNSIHNTQELKSMSNIPILGVVGKSKEKTNLVVLDRPRSALSESFRAIRSSLQFLYRKLGVEGSKTVLVTSSVSGEGKTYCSMNIASVFALSEKRTLLIGLDLRKPKIFDDFEISNDVGVTNYLIGQNSLEEIIQNTTVEHLDIITSGMLPPNPSELLMTDEMDQMMETLRTRYDYIVLDTPPIGLVADSLSLMKHADATLYVVRQDLTKKGMLDIINEKYKTGEVKHISFLFNYFKQKARYGYGYGYGYGAYGKGYGTPTKAKAWYKRLF